MRPTHIINLILILGCALLLGGCHSSKKSAVSTPRPPADNFRSVGDVPWLKDDGSGESRLIGEAFTWIGVPYRYGGDTRKGVDCSGLMVNVFRKTSGIKIPRNSAEQQKYCKNVRRKDALPGDLVFFTGRAKGSGVGHVGLYIGNDRFIHASSSRGVIVSNLNQGYYTEHYHSMGRVEEFAAACGRGFNRAASGETMEVPLEILFPEETPTAEPEVPAVEIYIPQPSATPLPRPDILPETEPEPESGTETESETGTVPEIVPGSMPETVPETVPVAIPERVPTVLPVPVAVSDSLSARSDSIRSDVRRAMQMSF